MLYNKNVRNIVVKILARNRKQQNVETVTCMSMIDGECFCLQYSLGTECIMLMFEFLPNSDVEIVAATKGVTLK